MVIFNHNNSGYCGPVLPLSCHGVLLPGEGSGIRLSSYWPWFGPGLNWPGLFFCLVSAGGAGGAGSLLFGLWLVLLALVLFVVCELLLVVVVSV
jgi:hypothetical protein